jgi:hypothetical protein
MGEAGCSNIAVVRYVVRNGTRQLWTYARIVYRLSPQINPKTPVFSVSRQRPGVPKALHGEA